jgi:hypothetical protein
MTDSERVPAQVFCLAEFLCEEMEARGWRTEDVVARMSADADEFVVNLLALDLMMCVQDDKLLVGDRQFAGLAKAFGVSEEFFRNLDDMWRKRPDRRAPFSPPDSIFGPISRRASFHVVRPNPPYTTQSETGE